MRENARMEHRKKEMFRWSGSYFGFRDGDELWARDGRYVGYFSDKDVFGQNNKYIGEVIGDRLRTQIDKKGVTCRLPLLAPKIKTMSPAALGLRPKEAKGLPPGFEDFPDYKDL